MGNNSDRERAEEPTTARPPLEMPNAEELHAQDSASTKANGLPRALDTKDLPGLMAHHGIQIAKQAADIAKQRSALQDLEVALIGRIADVDDDRRQTLSRLNRALQSHREELDVRLRRHGSFVATMMLLVLVLAGAAFGYLYLQLGATRQALLDELVKVQETAEEIKKAGAGTTDQATLGRENRIDRAVEQLNEARPKTEQTSEKTGDAVPSPAGTGKEMPAASESEPAPLSEAPPTAQSAAGASSTPSSEPAPQSAPAKAPEQSAAPKANQTTQNEPVAQRGIGVLAASPAPAAPASPNPSQTPYAVQIKGTYTLDGLRKFAAGTGTTEPLYYREESLKERPLFVLIHSLHPTREAAQDAAQTLPFALKSRRVVVRKLPSDAELKLLTP